MDATDGVMLPWPAGQGVATVIFWRPDIEQYFRSAVNCHAIWVDTAASIGWNMHRALARFRIWLRCIDDARG